MLSRRGLLIGLAGGLVLAGPAIAQADPVTQAVIRQLEARGFVIAEVRRTLLGRMRIVSVRGEVTRELVIDPRNGAILRDYTVRADGRRGLPELDDLDEGDDDRDREGEGDEDDRDGDDSDDNDYDGDSDDGDDDGDDNGDDDGDDDD